MSPLMQRLLPSTWPVQAWRVWHAGILGSGIVAYLSADEDTYTLHQFSGYLFAGLAVARLGVALSPWAKGPLTLRRPALPPLAKLKTQRWTRPSVYSLLRPWMAVALVALLGLAGLSGIGADWLKVMEKPHEWLGEIMPWVVLAHLVIVVGLLAKRSVKGVAKGAASVGVIGALALGIAGFAPGAQAGEAHQSLLAELTKRAKAENPRFSGFDAKRGEALFTARHTANPELPSCTSCHTSDPRAPGKHAKTGRAIDPMAVSANPERFTDLKQFDKRFSRDCDTVMGRPCTAVEQGDFATFMINR